MRYFTVVALVFAAVAAQAMPISPEYRARLEAEGRFDEVRALLADAKARGVDAPNPNPYRFPHVEVVDTLNCLAILTDFDDWLYTGGVVAAEPSDFVDMLYSTGVMPYGSMCEFYWENSYGQTLLTGDVTQWLRMPHPYSYYEGGNHGFGYYPANAQGLVVDAIYAADPYVDFSQFDNDGDGWVDALFVVHAGAGAEEGVYGIWSHQWSIPSPIMLDGVYIQRYSMEPEESGGSMVGPGVYCHEFGHVLGLPDMYDTDYSSSGLGMWSVMAGGSWGMGGHRPVHFDAWCKSRLGWLTPSNPTTNQTGVVFSPVEFTPDMYRLWQNGTVGPEYFLVEFRKRESFDLSLPGEGFLIYHVDELQSGNQNEWRPLVGLEQADGLYGLENGYSADAGDPWPGSTSNRSFDDLSLPSSRSHDGLITEVAVWDISDVGATMTANLDVAFARPYLTLDSLVYDDSFGGDGDGRAEPGETVDVAFWLHNLWADATNTVATLTTGDPLINVTDGTSALGTIPGLGGSANNTGDPFSFTVDPTHPIHEAAFVLDVAADNGQWTYLDTIMIGWPSVMLVDDDGGLNLQTYYDASLDFVGVPYDRWDRQEDGSVSSATLGIYNVVIWYTARSNPALDSSDRSTLRSFLDGGGKLFVSSQDAAAECSVSDPSFLSDYLHAGYDGAAILGVITGVTGDPIGDGFTVLPAGMGGANNASSPDRVTPAGGSSTSFEYPSGDAAVWYDGSHQVVFFAFPWEAINQLDTTYASRTDVLKRVFTHFGVPMGIAEDDGPSLPTAVALHPVRPNPFNPVAAVSFDLPSYAAVRLDVYNVLGQRVATLVDGFLTAGSHTVRWNASDAASGIYFARLAADGEAATRKMVLLR